MRAERLRNGTFDQSLSWQSHCWISALLLFAVSLLIRLPGLNHFPRTDELYTLLAARGWLIDSIPHIADGVYKRAELFTIIVAWFFHQFGESLVVARLPPLLAGSLLVVAVFLWTRSVAGNLAAWIAGLFVCFSPLSIQLSQYARFYTLFALTFWLGAVGIYALVERRPGWRRAVPIAAGSLLCLALSFHLQPLTLIGIVGLGMWVGLAVVMPWLWRQRGRPQLLWTVILLGMLLVVIAAIGAIQAGIVSQLWGAFTALPLHAVPRNEVWFYQLELIQRYPSLWPVFPFLALLAAATRPRPTLFCCCIFIPSFAILSLAPMKHFIYIYFIMPFLFVVWAVTLARLGHVLWRCIVTATERALAKLAPDLPPRPFEWGLIGLSVLFLMLSNGAVARTLLKPFGIAMSADESSADWATAVTALQPWLGQTSIILTPDDVYAVYYLGDYDIAVNPSRLSEVSGGHEFSLDARTGRPVVGTADSLELIMSCYAKGVFIADLSSFPLPFPGSDPINQLIRSRMTPIELPRGTGVYAFHWTTHGDTPARAACAALPAARDRARRGSSEG
jgi:4-amino-4-deoxy-L-arabinose transferase-like glycosyltransferase